jgi:zona occludens toxin (predicted ATPase)
MLAMITGTPGSGKTLYAVSLILKFVDENKKLAAQGKEIRGIFSDIDGLNIDGVEPAPDDWTTTPPGSIIFYDEVQRRPDFKAVSASGNSKSHIVTELETHRHKGYDIFLITQFPVLINQHVRALVGEHYHLHRGWGLPSATVYLWAYCVTDPNSLSKKRIAERDFRFNYPKRIFKYYKSATIHTHKMRIPSKFLVIVGSIFLGIWFAYHQLTSSRFIQQVVKSDKSSSVPTGDSQPARSPVAGVHASRGAASSGPDSAVSLDLELHRPALIVSDSAGNCTAKNRYGAILPLSTAECLQFASSPGRLMYGSASPEVAPAAAPASSDAELSASLQTKI